jgi:hypothetical protein
MQAKIIQIQNIITIELPTANDAADAIATLTAKVNGTELPSEWMGLTDSANLLGLNRSALARRIDRTEKERVAGNKTDWRLGKHYRRKPGTDRWQVNCSLIGKSS